MAARCMFASLPLEAIALCDARWWFGLRWLATRLDSFARIVFWFRMFSGWHAVIEALEHGEGDDIVRGLRENARRRTPRSPMCRLRLIAMMQPRCCSESCAGRRAILCPVV